VKEIKKEATSAPKRPIEPEVKVEKPKEDTRKEEVKPVEERKNEVKEPVMEKVKEEAPKIEKPSSFAPKGSVETKASDDKKKEELPSANLLGDDNEKSLNQGETVDL